MSLRHQPSLIPAVDVILISFLSQVNDHTTRSHPCLESCHGRRGLVPGFFHLFDKDKHYLYAHGTPLSSILFPFRYVQLTIDSSRGDKAKFKFGEPDKNGVRQLFVYLPDEQDRG